MKTFLAVVAYGLLTLFAVAGGIWTFKEPIALKVCGMVKRNVSPDECVKSVAVYLNKAELCEEVKGVDFKYENPPKQECYTDIAARTNDPDLCSKVEGGFISQTEFSCRYKVAYANKNAAACASLEGSESRLGNVQDKNTCFTAIGKTEADADTPSPKKEPPPLALGMSVATFDLIAYGLIGLWALAIVIGLAKKMSRKKGA